MLDNKTWYHGITRKAIIAFGVMFNNLHIRRRDTDGSIVQTLRIPLAYAAKNKMLQRIQALPDPTNTKSQVILPRLSFEVISYEYDGARKINLINKTGVNVNGTVTNARSTYGPVPYNLTLNLYAYAKNQDDGLQIFEQIVPAFNPDFNVTVNMIPELGIKHDLPIILNSVTYDDAYEGNVESERMIIWTFTFTMKLYYYGPITNQAIIREAIATVFNDPGLAETTAKYVVATDPGNALPGTTFDFVQTTTENLG